jgi:RNA polymerase sigma factor (sigma-70 family)
VADSCAHSSLNGGLSENLAANLKQIAIDLIAVSRPCDRLQPRRAYDLTRLKEILMLGRLTLYTHGMTEPADLSIATRASLLQRLKNCDDQSSWQEFYDLYRGLIGSFALKAGLTPSEAEEVVQETVIGVARKLPEFSYNPAKCSFKTWLLNQTVWRIKDQLRKRPPQGATVRPIQNDTGRTGTVERIPDASEERLALLWENDWQQAVLVAALHRVKRSANLKDCQIFDLHVLRGIEPRQVAGSLGVTVARVYLAKHRIGRLIKREVAALKGRL